MKAFFWTGAALLGWGTYNLISNTSNAAAFGSKVLTDITVDFDTNGKPQAWYNLAAWLAFRPKLVVRVRLINPSNITVWVQQPFVIIYASEELMKKKEFLAMSNISDQYFEIRPNKDLTFAPLSIEIPASRLLSQMATAIKAAITGNRQVKVIMKKQTRIKGIPAPIVETEEYQLKL